MRCFDLEGVARFSSRAEVYALARPSYPPEAIGFITEGARGARPIIDLAAGTAIGTDLIARRGLRCVGIEPNVEMLARAGELPGRPLVAGKAETMPLRDGATDLLTVFNAFHWFQPDAFFLEAHRVLTPGGKLALLWNDWNLGDPFTAAFVKLMRSHAGDFPPEDREAEVAPLYATRFFRSVERRAFPNMHTLDLPRLKMRMQSMSYIPAEGDAWTAIERELDALFEEYARSGSVRHLYDTSVFVAIRA